MTPEQQRIAIATALRWKQSVEQKKAVQTWKEITGEDLGENHGIPNYPEDLNACHEMEKHIKGRDWDVWLGHLEGITNCGYSKIEAMRATPPQRCEAFLKTIGKWKD